MCTVCIQVMRLHNVAPHLQFGQQDKPRADLMIDESAKKLSSLQRSQTPPSRREKSLAHFELFLGFADSARHVTNQARPCSAKHRLATFAR